MENLVKTQILRTTLTGTIEGQAVTINFENKVGQLPENVSAVCVIQNNESPMQPTTVNINYTVGGNKTTSIMGTVSASEIQMLLTGIENEIQEVLLPVV